MLYAKLHVLMISHVRRDRALYILILCLFTPLPRLFIFYVTTPELLFIGIELCLFIYSSAYAFPHFNSIKFHNHRFVQRDKALLVLILVVQYLNLHRDIDMHVLFIHLRILSHTFYLNCVIIWVLFHISIEKGLCFLSTYAYATLIYL